MKFITVKESHYLADLSVLKSRLESEGIKCRLKNELTTQILNHIPSFLVELQVPESDLERVREILVGTGELSGSTTKPVCPACGSEKIKLKLSVKKRIQVFFSVVAVALFMSNLPMDKVFKDARYKCSDCGVEF
jgi:transposase-like protein